MDLINGDSGKSTDIANGLSFYRKSDINEATAIGAEARAMVTNLLLSVDKWLLVTVLLP